MLRDEIQFPESLASYLEAYYAASDPVSVIRQNQGSEWLLSTPIVAMEISEDNGTSVLRLGVPPRLEVTFMEPYPELLNKVHVPNEDEFDKYGTPLISR